MPIRNDEIQITITDYDTPGQAGIFQVESLNQLRQFLPKDIRNIQHAVDIPWHTPLAPGNPWGTNVGHLGIVYINIRPPETISYTLTSPDKRFSKTFNNVWLHQFLGFGLPPDESDIYSWHYYLLHRAFPEYTGNNQFSSIGKGQGDSYWDIPQGSVINVSMPFVPSNLLPIPPTKGPYTYFISSGACREGWVGGEDGGQALWQSICDADVWGLDWDKYINDFGPIDGVYRDPNPNAKGALWVDSKGVPYSSAYRPNLAPFLYPYTDSNGWQVTRWITPEPIIPISDLGWNGTFNGSFKGWSINVLPKFNESKNNSASGFIQVPAFYVDLPKGFAKMGIGGQLAIMIGGLLVSYIIGPVILEAIGSLISAGGAITADAVTMSAIESTGFVATETSTIALPTVASTLSVGVPELTVVAPILETVAAPVFETGVFTTSLTPLVATSADIALATPTVIGGVIETSNNALFTDIATSAIKNAATNTLTQSIENDGKVSALGVVISAVAGGAGVASGALSSSLPSFDITNPITDSAINLTPIAVSGATSSVISAGAQSLTKGDVDSTQVAIAGATTALVGIIGSVFTTDKIKDNLLVKGGDKMLGQDEYNPLTDTQYYPEQGGNVMLGDYNPFADEQYYPADSATGINAISTVMNYDGSSTITYDDGSQVNVPSTALSNSSSIANSSIANSLEKAGANVLGAGIKTLLNNLFSPSNVSSVIGTRPPAPAGYAYNTQGQLVQSGIGGVSWTTILLVGGAVLLGPKLLKAVR